MKVFIGYDHRGVQKAYKIMEYLIAEGNEVNEPFDASTPDDDYPDICKTVCEKVKKTKGSVGILLCGTGIGMVMAANRLGGIRAVLANDEKMAYFARRHEDANVLILSAGYSDGKVEIRPARQTENIIKTFLTTPFEGDRHVRRIKKLEDMTQK